MHIVIDGYNLIYVPRHPAADAGGDRDDGLPFDAAQDGERVEPQEQLISRLAAYREAEGSGSRASPPRITVVFDGHPRGRPYPVTEEHLSIEVVYSGPGVEADETIKEMVRQSDHRRDMLIVTSDTQLQRICGRLGAQVTDSASFRSRVGRELRRRHQEQPREPLVKEEGVPESEVDAWLEDLGLTDESNDDLISS